MALKRPDGELSLEVVFFFLFHPFPSSRCAIRASVKYANNLIKSALNLCLNSEEVFFSTKLIRQ